MGPRGKNAYGHRGQSNKNANRLLRQYLTWAAGLRQFSRHDLDNIVNRINTRPRRVLDWATSAELFWPRVRAQYVA
jgi:IS30 family transposase